MLSSVSLSKLPRSDLYQEAETYVTSAELDRDSSTGWLTIVIRNPTDDKTLKLVRSPIDLLLTRQESEKDELQSLRFDKRQLEIEKWSGDESPVITLKPGEHGWLKVRFTSGNAAGFERLFPSSGEHSISGTLTLKHPPYRSVVGDDLTTPSYMIDLDFTIE